MPRKKDGLTTTKGWQEQKLSMRPTTRKALRHAAAETGLSLSETADSLLDMALTEEWIRVPIIGRVGCGDSVVCEEHVEDWISLPAAAAKGADFALRATGDSMTPTISDGDLVLVHQQPAAELGQIVVVCHENEAVIKRLAGTNGVLELRSDNTAYPPLRLPGGSIMGRVIRVIKEV